MKKLFFLGLMLCMVSLLGCVEDDDGENFDPVADQGALFINNDGFNPVHVYVDGERVPGRVGGGDSKGYSYPPGVYRVIVVDRETDRQLFRDELDILEDRVTVIDLVAGGVSRIRLE